MGGACSHSLELTGLAGDEGSVVHRLDPRAKIIGLFAVTVVAVSSPVALWPVYVAATAVLVAVAAAGRVPARALWRRVRIVLFPVLLVTATVPFVRTGGEAWAAGPLTLHEAGLGIAAAAGAKALVGTFAAALLGATTTFPSALQGLAALRAPRLLVLVAAFMYRYLFVVVEEAGRMRAAVAARGYRPRTALQATSLGRVATALFLRSFHRGERVHLAMLARGYRSEMPSLQTLSFGRADLAFVAAIVASLASLRIGLGTAA